jgi:hypothetical protein
LPAPFRAERYPFWSVGRLGAVKRVDVFAKATGSVTIGAVGSTVRDSLGAVGLGPLKGTRLSETPATPTDPYALELSRTTIDELWLAVSWGAAD